MKLKLEKNLNHIGLHLRGTDVEVDKIRYDKSFVGNLKLRVVSIGKKPFYLSIDWFQVGAPDSFHWDNKQ